MLLSQKINSVCTYVQHGRVSNTVCSEKEMMYKGI